MANLDYEDIYIYRDIANLVIQLYYVMTDLFVFYHELYNDDYAVCGDLEETKWAELRVGKQEVYGPLEFVDDNLLNSVVNQSPIYVWRLIKCGWSFNMGVVS